jgi:hypothetical protein
MNVEFTCPKCGHKSIQYRLSPAVYQFGKIVSYMIWLNSKVIGYVEFDRKAGSWAIEFFKETKITLDLTNKTWTLLTMRLGLEAM